MQSFSFLLPYKNIHIIGHIESQINCVLAFFGIKKKPGIGTGCVALYPQKKVSVRISITCCGINCARD